MAVFSLIHGCAQNAEGWNLLQEELARRGHTSVAVRLPLNQPELRTEGYADEIARQCLAQCGQDAENLIAVAHSVSGIFLPLLASQLPLRAMVYVSAALPKPGLSAMDQARPEADMFNPAWIGKDPRDPAVARQFLFHDCPDNMLPWLLTTTIRFYPQRALEEVTPLKAWPATRVAYVACLDDRTLLHGWQKRAARDRLGVEPIVLPGGHCPHVARPSETAEAILAGRALEVNPAISQDIGSRRRHAVANDCVPVRDAAVNFHSRRQT